jgi:hypothetical protein
MVVLVFPLAQLLGELRRASENHSPVELVRVRPVAAFHLPIAFRATPRDVPVRDAEIPQMPREVSTEFGAMISLNPLDGHGKSAANLLDEVSGRLDGIMRIDAEDAVPGRFVDRRELVEAAAAKLEVLDVDLDRLPRDMNLAAAPRPGAVSLQGHPGNTMLFENPEDGGRRDVHLVVPLQEEADPERTVLALAPDLEDQGNDMRRGGEWVMARPSRAIVETNQPLLAVAFTPAVEERP